MSTKTRRIRVTATDIAKGRRYTITLCPIARAIKRKFRTKRVQVHPGYVTINGVDYFFGVSVRRFIKEFDRKIWVVPFEFDIEPWIKEAN